MHYYRRKQPLSVSPSTRFFFTFFAPIDKAVESFTACRSVAISITPRVSISCCILLAHTALECVSLAFTVKTLPRNLISRYYCYFIIEAGEGVHRFKGPGGLRRSALENIFTPTKWNLPPQSAAFSLPTNRGVRVNQVYIVEVALCRAFPHLPPQVYTFPLLPRKRGPRVDARDEVNSQSLRGTSEIVGAARCVRQEHWVSIKLRPSRSNRNNPAEFPGKHW